MLAVRNREPLPISAFPSGVFRGYKARIEETGEGGGEVVQVIDFGTLGPIRRMRELTPKGWVSPRLRVFPARPPPQTDLNVTRSQPHKHWGFS